MTGWCPYIDGTLKEAECHHDGYCSDCPYKKDDDKKETLTHEGKHMITTQSAKLSCIDDFYNKHRLIMQEDKCKSCEFFYTCPFILASYNEVVEGD